MAEPGALYRDRAAAAAAEEGRLAALSFRISVARLATFVAAAAAAVAWGIGQPGALFLTLAALLAAAFAALISWHDRVLTRERRARLDREINERALARLERRFRDLPIPVVPEALAELPLARDLNLFGAASLSELLGTAHTPLGRARLAAWITAPAAPTEVRARQEAVHALRGELEVRQELEAATVNLTREPKAPDAFLAWAEGEPWLAHRPALLWLARLLALTSAALFTAWLTRQVPFSAFALSAVANLGLAALYSKPMAAIFSRLEAHEGAFRAYSRALALAEAMPGEAARLVELRRRLREGEGAARAIAHLARLLLYADVRHSSIGHPLLLALTLWDFHLLARLEAWQTRNGRKARAWLEALAEVEALAALAALAHDHPQWAFPSFAEPHPPRLTAEGLGHPLLPPAARVDNDVTLGPPGTFLLVTGSNMSGKSTLLRALGLNVLLAQAGGPVCARALALPPLALGTSILVEDSLASGVSFFLAELQRLKAILDEAAAAKAEGRTLLFLLDEVLRGTNSAERRIAVRRVIARLAELEAIGAVTTHDLELADGSDLAGKPELVHFRETLNPHGEGVPMTFDYLLRPGLATTTNALVLLAMVGIGEEGRSPHEAHDSRALGRPPR